MKLAYSAGVMIATYLTALQAGAQAKPPAPRLELRVDGKLGATAVLVGVQEAEAIESCSLQAGSGDMSRSMRSSQSGPLTIAVQPGGVLASSTYIPADGNPCGYFQTRNDACILHQLAQVKNVSCTPKARGKDKQIQIPVEIVLEGKTIRLPSVVAPDEVQVQFSGWGLAALNKLGTLKSECLVRKHSTTIIKQTTSQDRSDAGCAVSWSGDKLHFHIDDSVQDGQIQVSFTPTPTSTPNAAKTPATEDNHLLLDVDVCRFRAVGTVRSLVAGASKERLELVPSAAEQGLRCWGKLDHVTHLRMGDVTISASVIPESSRTLSPKIEITGIPDDLPLGVREFELRTSQGLVGLASMEVVPKVTANPKLEIDYRLRMYGDAKLSATVDIAKLQPYFENASGFSDGGIAIVNAFPNPIAEPASPKRFVVANTVTLQIPKQLPEGNMQSWRPIAKADLKPLPTSNDGTGGAKYEFDSFEVESEDVWVISSNALGSEVWFDRTERLIERPEKDVSPAQSAGTPTNPTQPTPSSPTETTTGSSTSRHEPLQTWPWRVLLDGARTITFDVLRQTDREIKPRLVLMRVIKTFALNAQGERIGRNAKIDLEPVLEIDVPLAVKARRESVPLPIRDLLIVDCKEGDTAINGQTHAINDEAMRNGSCEILVNNQSNDYLRLREVLALFGPQTILVSVSRDGVEKKQIVWSLRLENEQVNVNDRMVLPIPSGDDNAKGLYTIEARIAAQVTGDTFYRGATKDRILEGLTQPEQTDLRFVAKLRPRGPLGWKVLPIRTYLTAFVPLGGFRTPAAPAALRNSSQPTSIQFVPPTLGALFSVEYFNADKGVNPLPLNPAFQAGMNIVNLSNGEFAPTILVGGAVTVPVIEGSQSQFGTKATLGAYYEFDPRVESRYAHHFLMTLGLNIGSLLSGNTK